MTQRDLMELMPKYFESFFKSNPEVRIPIIVGSKVIRKEAEFIQNRKKHKGKHNWCESGCRSGERSIKGKRKDKRVLDSNRFSAGGKYVIEVDRFSYDFTLSSQGFSHSIFHNYRRGFMRVDRESPDLEYFILNMLVAETIDEAKNFVGLDIKRDLMWEHKLPVDVESVSYFAQINLDSLCNHFSCLEHSIRKGDDYTSAIKQNQFMVPQNISYGIESGEK